MLNIDISTQGNTVVVDLEGRLDASTSPELKEKLGAMHEEVNNLELHIDKLAYVSSAGLRVILQYHNQLKQRGGKLVVFKPNDLIMEVFEDTGLSGCLNISR